MGVDCLQGKVVVGMTTNTNRSYELDFKKYARNGPFPCLLTVDDITYTGKCEKTDESTICSKFPEYHSVHHNSYYNPVNTNYNSVCDEVTYEFNGCESANVTGCSDSCMDKFVTIN